MDVSDLLTVYTQKDNYQQLFCYALQLTRNMDDAYDLIGDLALAIYNKKAMQTAREPMAYFKTCIRNNYYNIQRKNARIVSVDPLYLSKMNNAGFEKEYVHLEDKEIRAKLRKALSDYSDEQIGAFEMYYLDKYSQKELAESMGIPANALAQQIKRMKDSIRRKHPILFLQVMLIFLTRS